jgi:hypothetical protein
VTLTISEINRGVYRLVGANDLEFQPSFAISALLAVLVTSCSSPRSSKPSGSQVLGSIVVTLDGYAQEAGSAWHAVILATNTSGMKVRCMAFSYAAGLPQGSTSVVTTNLDVVSLPKRLVWTRREPEIHGDPRMMERYGIGRVFELQPGGRIRFLLPIVVPQAHPNDFVEHFVFGYSSPSSGAAQGAYETYVAELKR